MVQRTLPGIGLTGFWALGYDGWKNEMDANLRLLSLLVQARAISRTTALPESDAAQGDIYIVAPYDSAGPASDDPAEDSVVIFDDGDWVEYEPVEGWKFFLDDEQVFVVFRGSEGWVEFEGGEGGEAGEGEDTEYPVTMSALTAYTVTAAEAGKVIGFTADEEVTITIEDTGTEAMGNGKWFRFVQLGDGPVIFETGSSDVEVISQDDAMQLTGRGAGAVLFHWGSDVWTLEGNLTAGSS